MTSKLLDINLLKSTYKIISTFSKKPDKKSEILEPLTTLITLSIISFKSVGTKIAVYSNKIYIQEPSPTQGLVRWTFGNNREEIHFLLKPIFRCVKLFKPNENDNIRLIFNFAIKGLKLLKQSYYSNSSTLCHTLDLYISILDSALSPENQNLEIDSLKEFNTLRTNMNLSEVTKINLDSIFKNIWKDDEIEIICQMLNIANSNIKVYKTYISAIESIISNKEKKINKIIEETTNLF